MKRNIIRNEQEWKSWAETIKVHFPYAITSNSPQNYPCIVVHMAFHDEYAGMDVRYTIIEEKDFKEGVWNI